MSLLLLKSTIYILLFLVDLCELNLNVKKSFEQHNLRLSGDNLIDVGEIIKVLTTIFENIDTNRKNSINVAQCIDMTLNWLLNVFDRYVLVRAFRLRKMGCCSALPSLLIFLSTFLTLFSPIFTIFRAEEILTTRNTILKISFRFGLARDNSIDERLIWVLL